MGHPSPSASGKSATPPRDSLRRRTLWSIGLTIVLLVAALYAVSRTIILNGFENLEREDAEETISRAANTFHDNLVGLSRSVTDFSSWDQTYSFVTKGSPTYAKSEFPDETFAGLKLSFVVIMDSSNRVVFSKGYDFHKHEQAPLPSVLTEELTPNSPLLQFTEVNAKTSGIMVIAGEPALVVAQPILHSDNSGPIAGAVIMGRWLDAREIGSIGQAAHLELSLMPLDSPHIPRDMAVAAAQLKPWASTVVRAANDETMSAYKVLEDVFGRPAMILKVRLPRTMYEQGRVSLLQFLTLLLAGGAIFAAVTLSLLERLVLRRLARLSSDVAGVGASGDIAARVQTSGHDELAALGDAINRMLAALEASQQTSAEQNARVHLLIERMPAILWTTDANLNFVTSMGAGLKALGLRPNEVAGVSLFDYFKTRDVAFEPIAAHQRALAGQSSTFVLVWMGRTFECHTEPLRDASEVIVGVIGVALDSTERLKVEEALRKSEASSRSLIEGAPYGICRCTVGGSFTLVNRKLVQMLGCHSEDDLLGLNLGMDIFEDLGDHERFVSRLHETGSAEGFELNWRRRDGKSITVQLGGRAVRDTGGKIAYFEVIAEDITDRKMLELQLRQSQKMQAIGQLAGGVAHDFNNLLMVVKGHLELILTSMPPSDPLYPRLDQVQKAANRASSLTRQLLAFSRMQVLQAQVLDLNAVVSGMIQMLSRLIGENIELVFRPGGILGRVKADAGQMEQVLLNLVVNARDAMPSGGRLTIETANVELDESYAHLHAVVKPGPYVLLAVSDTGMGMDAATQARIFEPFFTTKEAGKGTGLGLSTVYGVVKQSDGYIWVYSEPDHGTTFKIYLPLTADAVEPPKVQRAAPAPVRGEETILLVEDEESVRSLVRDFLISSGHKVTEAHDGADAIRIVEAQQGAIQLLITDVVMPKMSGRELANSLKERLPELKVLFISGYTDDAIVRHGVLEGGVAFLQKPFTLRALATRIREVLDGVPVSEYSS